MILSIRLASISNVPQEHCDTSILIGPKLNGGFFSPLNQTGPTVSGPGLLLPRVQLGPAYGRFIRNWPFTIVLLNDGFVPLLAFRDAQGANECMTSFDGTNSGWERWLCWRNTTLLCLNVSSRGMRLISVLARAAQACN